MNFRESQHMTAGRRDEDNMPSLSRLSGIERDLSRNIPYLCWVLSENR